MTKDALDTLGSLINIYEQGRDAIHLAVMPIVAAHDLSPGQNIGIDANGRASVQVTKSLGVVDPFLKEGVKKGEGFWFIVYPRQITSLQHIWAHPGIDEVEVVRATSVAISEQWIRNWLATTDSYPPAYDVVIEAALRHRTDAYDSDYLTIGEDASGDIPNEFWDHLEVISGMTFPRSARAEYFSCSC